MYICICGNSYIYTYTYNMLGISQALGWGVLCQPSVNAAAILFPVRMAATGMSLEISYGYDFRLFFGCFTRAGKWLASWRIASRRGSFESFWASCYK